MANWIEDPQNRENVEKVSEEIKLPLYKASAKGEFRPWLKESFNKLEDYLIALKKLAESKEPKIDWKSGGNLEKTDEYKKNDSSFLLDTKGSNQLYEDVIAVINALDKCPYKIGDMYITTNSQNPALTWAGTTWQKIEGRFLRATNGSEAAGTTSGSDSKTLTVANLPSHSHTASASNSGNHTHSQASHSHSRGGMEISGGFNAIRRAGGTGPGDAGVWGAFAQKQKFAGYVKHGDWDEYGSAYNFYASRSWSGSTTAAAPAITNAGKHTHAVSVANTGSGTAFDIKPAYITVHIWKRLS